MSGQNDVESTKCFGTPIQKARRWLFLPKMPSGVNAFETNDIQEDEIESALTKPIRM
jgi:hypothetical protein